MKKALLILVFAWMCSMLFGTFVVGDIVDDFSWTDNTGATQSVYGLTAAGKAVVIFWGGTG